MRLRLMLATLLALWVVVIQARAAIAGETTDEQTVALQKVSAANGSPLPGFVSDPPVGLSGDTYCSLRNQSGDTRFCSIWRIAGNTAEPVLDDTGAQIAGIDANVWCGSGGALCVVRDDKNKKLMHLKDQRAEQVSFAEGETPTRLAGYLHGASAKIYCPQNTPAVFRVRDGKASRIALRGSDGGEFWASGVVEHYSECLILGCRLDSYKCAGVWRLTTESKLEQVGVQGQEIAGADLPELVATGKNVYLNAASKKGPRNFWVYSDGGFKAFDSKAGDAGSLEQAWIVGSTESVVYVRSSTDRHANGLVAIEDGKNPQLVRLADGKPVGGLNARPLDAEDGLLVECAGLDEEDPDVNSGDGRYYVCRGSLAVEVVLPEGVKTDIISGAIGSEGALLLDKNTETMTATLYLVNNSGKATVAKMPTGESFEISIGAYRRGNTAGKSGDAFICSAMGRAYCTYYRDTKQIKDNGLLVLSK